MSHLQRLSNKVAGIRKYIAGVSSLGVINNDRKLNDVMCEFLKSKNIKHQRWNRNYKGFFTPEKFNATLIKQNWDDFKIFIRTNYPNEQVKTKLLKKEPC